MEPSARHRVPKPARLIAAVTALLLAGGIVLVTGTASANGTDREFDNASAESRDRGSFLNRFLRDREEGDQDGRDDNAQEGDAKEGDAKEGDAKEGDAKDGDGQEGNGQEGNGQDGNGQDGNGNNEEEAEEAGEAEEFPGRDKIAAASDDDFVDINQVEAGDDPTTERRDGSPGSFVARCGTNANRHLNSDNFMVAPGKRNGAQHVHDYVGNLSTDAFSNDDSLHEAGTTCDRNNQSTFFWPVIRDTRGRDFDADRDGGGKDGNVGRILRPRSAELRFIGSKAGKVEELPDDLAIITGDAKVKTNGEANKVAQWTCSGFTNRITDQYPICPGGSKLMRILDFPNCWDGENLDSANHRTHTAFAEDDGNCQDGFKPIPQLRIILTYNQPPGRNFAVDSFPDQQHDPRTDHADFMNIAPKEVLTLMVDCINSGRNC